MGNTNLGIQNQSFMYREEARAKYFNKLINDLLPTGLYKSSPVERNNNLEITVPPLTCLIKPGNIEDDNSIDVSVRIETTQPQVISLERFDNPTVLDITRPYIVLRFNWSEQENNYMDILPVSFSEDPTETRDTFIKPNDLVLVKVLFEGDGQGGFKIRDNSSEAFDYTRQTKSSILGVNRVHKELAVYSSESESTKVFVTGGFLNTSHGRLNVIGGNYPSSGITNTTSLGRIDLVYVTELGEVRILEGIESVNPVAPEYQNKKVIAEIRRKANRSVIEGYEIFQVKVGERQGMTVASDFPILDAGKYFVNADNIEDAFQQVGNAIYDDIYGTGNPQWIKDYHIDWGLGTDQISAESIPIKDALGIIDSENVESALQELKSAIDTQRIDFDDHENTTLDSSVIHG